MRNLRLFPSLLVAGGALLVGATAPLGDDLTIAPTAAPSAAPARTASPPAPPPALGPRHLDPATGRYVAPFGKGRATLTLEPRLQERLDRYLESYAVPWGAVVVMEPATGRVLALAEHSRAEPGAKDLPLQARAPAASIFKIVTAAALLGQGVTPDEEVCYHGGDHRLQPRLLADDPRRDRRCVTLASAMGHSTNVVFAKLANRGLSPDALRAEASNFLFNAPIPFTTPVQVSHAEIPDDGFGLANTAAGFGDVRLSPLHGALLASIVANRGTFVPPVLVDSTEGVALPPAPPTRRVVSEEVAAAIADMMETTVTEGTARRAFRRPGPSLHSVSVAGKTGSLADRDPYRDNSWFVGFAPVDHPQVAVAVVIVNQKMWRIRATTVAREAFAAYFAEQVAARPSGVRTAAVR